MDKTQRMVLRDLTNLQDPEEAGCSYLYEESNKSSSDRMGTLINGKIDQKVKQIPKLKKERTEQKLSDYWPALCLEDRLFCRCKSCLINETKFVMRCIKCRKNCKACEHYEEKFADYVEPLLNSYIRLNSVPKDLIDMDIRRGSKEMLKAVIGIMEDAIGGRKYGCNKNVLWIDAYETLGANEKQDIFISFCDQKTAEKMQIYSDKNGGILQYAGIGIPFEVTILNILGNVINQEEEENQILLHDVVEEHYDPLWVPDMLDVEELSELFDESLEMENQDKMEEDDSSSGIESSDSEEELSENSGDNEESEGDTCDDDSSLSDEDEEEEKLEDEEMEDEEMEDEELEEEEEMVNGDNENDENINEGNVTELVTMNNMDEEGAETKENSTVILMGSTVIGPKHMNVNEIAVMENGTWKELNTISGDDEIQVISSEDDEPPQAKKARYSE